MISCGFDNILFSCDSDECGGCSLTVPPDIINEDSSVDMAVQEGEDAALTCRATGNPMPRVTWKKEDGDFILIRKQGNRDLMKGMCVCSRNAIVRSFAAAPIIGTSAPRYAN